MNRAVNLLLVLSSAAGCAPADEAPQPDATPIVAEARSRDGVAIRYEAHGFADTALVLVHGWTNTRGIFGEHPRTLSSRYRVVALDLAGHGESGAERVEWTMAAFGDDVVAVVEQLDLDPVVLVGFSMGAGVVLEAAPRLGGRVLGVVFVDALHDPDQPPADGLADEMEGLFRATWGDTAFLRAFAFTPDAPAALILQAAAMAPPAPREHWFPALRSFFAWQAMDFPSALERLDVPVAAINTTRQPTNLAALRRYAPTFSFDTLEGVGHAGILLQRTQDFDARLNAAVERFAAR